MITRCLFCKKSTIDSRSVEHIIPECMGSKKKVLPRGIVCDACNHYFAVKIEKPVLSDISFRNIRAYYQVENKKGKLPSLLGEIAGTGIRVNLKLRNGSIDIQPENERDRDQVYAHVHNQLDSGNFTPLLFPVDVDPPKQLMSRFLAKMALEALAYKYLQSEPILSMLIDEPYYDAIRNYARLGSGSQEWPYSQRRIYPVDTYMRHPETDQWVQNGFGFDILRTSRRETYYVFLFYGMEFVINVGGRSIKGYDEWLEENNNISPVVERLGLQLVSKINGGVTGYYLEGVCDTGAGIHFDDMQSQRKN